MGLRNRFSIYPRRALATRGYFLESRLGGLYYPRNDEREDGEGNWKYVDPFTGNAAIGYARLNVEDGQKIMWEQPWTAEEVDGRPWVDGFDLGAGVDVLRGQWVEKRKSMVVTLRSWNDEERK